MRFVRPPSTAYDSSHGRVDVLLACSAGGHLLQLFLLRQAWAGLDVAWVTHDKDDARSLLARERVYWAYGPTSRNVLSLVRNLWLAWRLLRELRPAVVVGTGAGVSVPFFWLSRLVGAKAVYVESLTRIERPSLSLRLVRPVASRVYVQWPELAEAVPESIYVGSVVGRP